jgi:sortase A
MGVRPEGTTDDEAARPPVGEDAGHELAAFYDRRAPAALAYCSRLCAPESIADAVEAAFAGVFEAAAGDEPLAGDALDRRLRSAVRQAAAERAPAPEASAAGARRLFERTVSDTGRSTCNLSPRLLAARAEGELSAADRERFQAHLRRCADCRAAERRFLEAERAYDALAGDDAPALGRSLLADLMASPPPRDASRFAREDIDWLEPDEFDWRPKVVQVPADALDGAPAEAESDEQKAESRRQGAELEPGPEWPSAEVEEPPIEEPPPVEDPPVEDPPIEDPPVEEPPVEEPPVQAAGSRGRLHLPRLASGTRKRIAIVMLVIGTLLLAEAAVTVLWKEPFTAFLAARAQDDLDDQLQKLEKDGASLRASDERELAGIDDASARERRRMALLAARLDGNVKEGEALGRIRIPKLGSDFVFVQGTEDASLRKGPGHYDGATSLPGEGGPVGIAGHRTTYEAPFRAIDELGKGDRITMRMPYGVFTYEVASHRIVPADFKGALAAEGGAGSGERLVLSACHPLYSADQRILVYARLVSSEPLGAALEDSAPAAVVPGVPAKELAQRRTAIRLERLGDRHLIVGLSGPDVRELQRLLGMPVTGTFDANTRAAVIEFQRTHGLAQDGEAGDDTKRALARRPRPPSRPPTPAAVPQQPQPGDTGTGQQPQDGSGQTTPPNTYGGQGGTQGGTGQGTYTGPSGGAPYTPPGGTAAPQTTSP